MKRYDLVVVGGGSGGYAAASRAAGLGLDAALAEGAGRLGGLCILKGCMPTKALLHAAEVLHSWGRGRELGLRLEGAGFDFGQVMGRKDRVIRDFASWRESQLREGGFEFVQGRARFLDPHTVELDSGRTLQARHFVIATGSEVSPPPLADLEEAGCIDSDQALELEELPGSLIVLGGGAVAVEFAQFFARLGTRVIQLQRSGRILRGFDIDAARELEKALVEEAIDLRLGARLVSARRKGRLREVCFEQDGKLHRAEAETILLATGRRPRTGGLGLEAAGVETGQGGRILCDSRMRTSQPHIYAAGDCTGPRAVVHMAVLQGEAAAWNIAGRNPPREMDPRLSLEVVFTDPQVAQTGLNEAEAGKRGVPCLAASHPFSDHGKSILMGVRHGFVKLLASPRDGEILGGACVGPQGGDLIHEITVAMARRTTVSELAAIPHYHPTLAEIWTYPAEELAGRTGGS